MVNPAADDFDSELRRFEYKVEAGAEFAVTHPLFDAGAMERFLERTTRMGLPAIPILATLHPFESVLNAEFMANEVPGVKVPEALMHRMRATRDDDAAAAEGVRIAQELGAALRRMVQGLHIAAPPGRPELALLTLAGIREGGALATPGPAGQDSRSLK
jgi:homocysteine S-methyltransferase